MSFLNKKVFLYTTLLWSFLIGTIVMLQQADLCRRGTTCKLVVEVIEPLGFLLLVPVILLPLAIIMFFVHDRAFRAWKKFAVIAVPILLALTFLITRDTGGSNFFSMDFSLYFLGLIYGLFFLISLIIIAVTANRR